MAKPGRILYKCRRCGKIDGSTHSPNAIISVIYAMDDRPQPFMGILIGSKSVHACASGQIGVSDLIGADEDEEAAE